MLSMNVDGLLDFLEHIPLEGNDYKIAEKAIGEIISRLRYIKDVGLGYLTLDRTSNTLSGGESQRIKLAYFLSMSETFVKGKQQRILFIFDEPTTGLHFYDVEKLLKSFDALLAKGHTIVVVEHNLEVIKSADWIIDLGPEAGDAGGNLVFAGKPEDLAGCTESHTATYLKD
jgi:excinuclease ABC subunit A